MKVDRSIILFAVATSSISSGVYGRRLGESRKLATTDKNSRKLSFLELLGGGLGGDGIGAGGIDSLLESLGIDLDTLNTTIIDMGDTSFTDLFGGDNVNGALSILDNLGIDFLSFNFTDVYERCCGENLSACNCPVRQNGTYAAKWEKSCNTSLAYKAGVKEVPENFLSDVLNEFMDDMTATTPDGFLGGMIGDFLSGIMADMPDFGSDMPDVGSLGDILGLGDGSGTGTGGSGSGPLGDILGQLLGGGGDGGGSLGDILGQITGGGADGGGGGLGDILGQLTGGGSLGDLSEMDGGGSSTAKLPDFGSMGDGGMMGMFGSMEDFDLVQMYEQMFGKPFDYKAVAANCCKSNREGFPSKFDMDSSSCTCPMRKTMADVWEEQCEKVIIPGLSKETEALPGK